jgi:hypothetical protein
VIREGRVLACSFHPELADDPRLHALLMALATAARDERETAQGRHSNQESSDTRPSARR